MIGRTLAHFEITGHLGTGGMGEVYEATDSKLGRSVAIQFLRALRTTGSGRFKSVHHHRCELDKCVEAEVRTRMEKVMLDDIIELTKSCVTAQLEGIRGDIRALDIKIDARLEAVDAKFIAVMAKIHAVDTKVESFRRELLSEVHRVEAIIR